MTKRAKIRVHGQVSPDVVAAIAAALAMRRSREEAHAPVSRWAQAARPAKPWHQNGRRDWRSGLRG